MTFTNTLHIFTNGPGCYVDSIKQTLHIGGVLLDEFF